MYFKIIFLMISNRWGPNCSCTQICAMKDGLHDQHFLDNDTIITSMKKWVTSTGEDFRRYGMQALLYHWKKCIANDTDHVEKYCLVAEKLFYPIVRSCFLYLL